MKTVQYKHHNLQENSEGFALWQKAKKTDSQADWKKLNDHLKDVDERAKAIVLRYK